LILCALARALARESLVAMLDARWNYKLNAFAISCKIRQLR